MWYIQCGNIEPSWLTDSSFCAIPTLYIYKKRRDCLLLFFYVYTLQVCFYWEIGSPWVKLSFCCPLWLLQSQFNELKVILKKKSNFFFWNIKMLIIYWAFLPEIHYIKSPGLSKLNHPFLTGVSSKVFQHFGNRLIT